MSKYDNVLYDVAGSVAWITINKPQKLNALDRRTVEEIAAAAGFLASPAASYISGVSLPIDGARTATQ